MFALFVRVLCSLLCNGYLVNTHSVVTLNDFIAQTGITLQSLDPSTYPDSSSFNTLAESCCKCTSYNLTGTLVMQQRRIQLIGFTIRVKIVFDCMQLFGFDGFEPDSATFFFTVQYVNNEVPDPKAFIHDIKAASTNQRLSGTEIMLLIHYILTGIGVKRCSLHNAAKLRYDSIEFGGNPERKFIPLICLRCIRGKTSDWYSNFGYFNKNNAEIAIEMSRIYKSPFRNSTFGPWLYALWNKSDLTDFHMAFKINLWRFTWLQKLSFSSEWSVVLNDLNGTDDTCCAAVIPVKNA